MCKTNVMHRQEDCMCKHVCTQPIRRSERMSLKEKQGMERKEKKTKKQKRPTKGKGEERKNEDVELNTSRRGFTVPGLKTRTESIG